MNPQREKGIRIDHIDGDTLNNRKINLRVTKPHQNSRNRMGANCNNKSGYRNVFWNSREEEWCVSLMIEGKNTKLGGFNNVDKAGEFAEEMRQEYYGEYAGSGEFRE